MTAPVSTERVFVPPTALRQKTDAPIKASSAMLILELDFMSYLPQVEVDLLVNEVDLFCNNFEVIRRQDLEVRERLRVERDLVLRESVERCVRIDADVRIVD